MDTRDLKEEIRQLKNNISELNCKMSLLRMNAISISVNFPATNLPSIISKAQQKNDKMRLLLAQKRREYRIKQDKGRLEDILTEIDKELKNES